MSSLPEQYLMAVDAGTGSCRAIIFTRGGDQVAAAQEEWVHPTIPEYPGSQVFDTSANWKLISKCISGVMSKASVPPSSIKAVGNKSMREGMVLYEESGKAIWACPNVDSRSSAEATRLVRNGNAKKIFSEGGDWVSISAPPRFLWIKKHDPELFRRIHTMTMISDWILYQLCGRLVTDPSAGSSSAMFNLRRRMWSERIAQICGIEKGMFPEVGEPGTTVGEVTAKASGETGLKQGTPVVLGGADTQLGLLGIGVLDPGQVAVLGGTFWQTTVVMDRPFVDQKMRLRTLCHALSNEWMMEGIGFYCGLTMRWFRDGFCQSEKEEAKARGVDPYVLMEELAGHAPPGSNGVIGIFANVMNSKHWVHASPSFLQFDVTDPAGSGKKECIRAIEESAAYVALGHLRIIESITGRKTKEVVFAGGGAKGKLWPQIIADVIGIDVRIPVVKESTSLGCAICAGAGIGWYGGVRSASREISKTERVLEPQGDSVRIYRDLYSKWLKVYARSLEIAEDGLLRPLWKPAGA